MPADLGCIKVDAYSRMPQVLACPPLGCLAAGTCDMSRYSLTSDLTKNCGIATDTAPVGTCFVLTFQVYDDLQVGRWHDQTLQPANQPTNDHTHT